MRQLLHEERSWWQQLHFTRPCLLRQAALLQSSSATADEKTHILKEMHSQAVVAAFCCDMENAYVLTTLGELQETPGLEAEAGQLRAELKMLRKAYKVRPCAVVHMEKCARRVSLPG